MPDILEEQIAYYRERAREYDEWFFRKRRYDQGADHTARWWNEVDVVRWALDRARPRGRILELACGTGIWTTRLSKDATTLTAVDASPEVLDINKARVADARVEYQSADLFSWEPTGQYDVIFFGFWLSHVPPDLFDPFWALVRRALAPGGTVFLVDNQSPRGAGAGGSEQTPAPDAVVTRRLNDGRAFQIVKVFYDPGELRRRLEEMGWTAKIRATETFFIYGTVNSRI